MLCFNINRWGFGVLGSDEHQEEGAEQLGEQASPFLARVLEVGDSVDHALLVSCDRPGPRPRGLLGHAHGCLSVQTVQIRPALCGSLCVAARPRGSCSRSPTGAAERLGRVELRRAAGRQRRREHACDPDRITSTMMVPTGIESVNPSSGRVNRTASTMPISAPMIPPISAVITAYSARCAGPGAGSSPPPAASRSPACAG